MNPTTDILDIKSTLHESIENIDDKEILLAIAELAERKYTPQGQYRLSPSQYKRIDAAHQQIESGDFLTNEQADLIVEKWLNA